ncbi:MAG TPA: hypothetical protein VIT88_13455 [Pyrinomonadaceae bacterium]
MTERAQDDKKEAVVALARRYREALREWKKLSRSDPAAATDLWKQMLNTEQSLFDALDELDELKGRE